MTTKKSLPLSDEELETYEATRDLYAELKQAAKEIEAGLGRVVYSPIIAARKNTGLSKAEFAECLGVSTSTLEDWEQRRTTPDTAALPLIAIARDEPAVFLTLTRARPKEATQK
ncbi:helix-turn-helix domain-containing protein [Duganella sp. P38]|uniref:helix-turn-helix domain-containing protein n=1 Tax=Duganella sp. P38 TaxID=3423949 RepID=UPI003D7B52DB